MNSPSKILCIGGELCICVFILKNKQEECGRLQSSFFVPPEYSMDNRLKRKIYQTAHLRTLMWDVNVRDFDCGGDVSVCVRRLWNVCTLTGMCACVFVCVLSRCDKDWKVGFTDAIPRSKFAQWKCWWAASRSHKKNTHTQKTHAISPHKPSTYKPTQSMGRREQLIYENLSCWSLPTLIHVEWSACTHQPIQSPESHSKSYWKSSRDELMAHCQASVINIWTDFMITQGWPDVLGGIMV